MESIESKQKLQPGVFQGSPEAPEKKTPLARVIRTMKSDASDVIRKNEETTVSIAVAEEKKRARQQQEVAAAQENAEAVPPAPKPIGRIIVVIVVILFVVLLVLGYIFILPKISAVQFPRISFPSFSKSSDTTITTSTIPAPILLAPSLITSDSEKKFNITNELRAEIFSSITAEGQQPLAIGFIKNMYFEENSASSTVAVSSNRLLMLTNAGAPEILTRSLENQFMVGFLGDENNVAVPFIVLQVSGNDTGIAGMLAWETNLPNFFDTLFSTTIAEGIVSSTKFKDIIVSNIDARIVTSVLGGSLVYAFANPTTIVITNNQSALETLLPIAATK